MKRIFFGFFSIFFPEEIKAISGSTTDNDPKDEVIFLLGGFQGKIEGSVKKLVLPTDICELFQNDPHQCKTTLGCAYCSHFDEKTSAASNKNSTFCYSNTKMKPAACSSEFQSGTLGKSHTPPWNLNLRIFEYHWQEPYILNLQEVLFQNMGWYNAFANNVMVARTRFKYGNC